MPSTDTDQATQLRAAGFDPPPYVGQEWRNVTVTWLPAGHSHIVTITGIHHLISGWSATVVRRQVDAAGATVESGCGAGSIYLRRLFREFQAVAVTADLEAARRLRLTNAQQVAVEQAHENNGSRYEWYVPTAPSRHHRTMNATATALVGKGVFEVAAQDVNETTYRLTLFGHVVYQQHPKIIRR